MPRIPIATYRLQLHADFGFDSAAAVADYLQQLGISHVYSSPYLQAATGSQHGYDISDHRQLNPEIGTEEDYAAFSAALAPHAALQRGGWLRPFADRIYAMPPCIASEAEVATVADAIVQAAISLVSHKLRAALTIAAISIGIMTVILIFMVEAGMSSSFARQLSTLGPNTLFVHKWKWGVNGNDWWKYKNRPQVTMLDARALQQGTTLPIAIAPMSNTDATVSYGDREVKGVDVRGTVDGYLDATGWQIRRGRFITAVDQELGANVCISGADIEDAFFKGQEPLGQQIRAGPNLRCTIIGIFARKGNSFGQSQDLRVVVPLSAFMRTFGSKRGLVVAVVAPEGKVRETEDEVTAVMRNARHLAPDQEENFSVNRQDKLLEGFNQMMMATNVTGILVGIITAIVAGIGIMNILLVSVKERTREIGIRRALGARRSTILSKCLCGAVMGAVVGGFLGVVPVLDVAIGHPSQVAEVAPRQLAAPGRERFEVRQLAQADAGGDVGQVHRQLHGVLGQRAAAGRGDHRQVLEAAPRLLGGAVAGELARVGVERDLARDEEQATGLDGVGVGADRVGRAEQFLRQWCYLWTEASNGVKNSVHRRV